MSDIVNATKALMPPLESLLERRCEVALTLEDLSVLTSTLDTTGPASADARQGMHSAARSQLAAALRARLLKVAGDIEKGQAVAEEARAAAHAASVYLTLHDLTIRAPTGEPIGRVMLPREPDGEGQMTWLGTVYRILRDEQSQRSGALWHLLVGNEVAATLSYYQADGGWFDPRDSVGWYIKTSDPNDWGSGLSFREWGSCPSRLLMEHYDGRTAFRAPENQPRAEEGSPDADFWGAVIYLVAMGCTHRSWLPHSDYEHGQMFFGIKGPKATRSAQQSTCISYDQGSSRV